MVKGITLVCRRSFFFLFFSGDSVISVAIGCLLNKKAREVELSRAGTGDDGMGLRNLQRLAGGQGVGILQSVGQDDHIGVHVAKGAGDGIDAVAGGNFIDDGV